MLLVRANHDDVVAVLRAADTDGLVGPSAASGWTWLWVDDESLEAIEHLDFPAYLWADETRSGLRIELRRPGGSAQRVSWTQGSDTVAMDALVTALVNEFGPPGSSDEVRALLARTDLDPDLFWDGLERLLDLPAVESAEPERCVLATRADPTLVRLGAAIAGPAWIMPVESGWTVLAPAGDTDSAGDVLAAAVSGATKRRDRVVLLWTRDEAFGLQVWRGGSIDVSWSWAGDWETVASDPLAFEGEVADAITGLNPKLHVPSLKALLRRKHLDAGAADSLVELLGLPGRVAATLRSSVPAEGLPGAELLQRATPKDAAVAAFRADWADRRRIRNRPLYLAYAVGTAVAAVVCTALTGLGIAIWMTDGSVIGQAGASNEDRVFVGVSALLALVLIPTAIYRLRRARQDRLTE